jgi:hypothetical protein
MKSGGNRTNMIKELIDGMRKYGYASFKVKPDLINPFASVIVVSQKIIHGHHPAFWSVLDKLGIDGKFGTQFTHQIKTTAIPYGVYFTFK